MILIITEKPSVGVNIASVVKATKKCNGYYEGNGYIVSWAVGHLVGFCLPDAYRDEWKQWSLETLPMIPAKWETVILERTAGQFGILKKLLNRDDLTMVVNAGDAGQEGELIQRHIYTKAGVKPGVPMKRLWISSMTAEAITEGLDNLKDAKAYDSLYYAALARAMSDWLIGMNCSRLYTCIFNAKPPLSAGRVQSPTLSEIVRRHLHIINFISEDYFTLSIHAGGIIATWFKEEGNLKSVKSFEEARLLEQRVQNKSAKVVSYITQQKKESRPQLHNLSSLQQEASKIYKYSAQTTLQAVQALYDKKLATYPRTESKYITEDMVYGMDVLMQHLIQNNVYGAIAEYAYKVGLNIDKRIVDNSKVEDHTAILPTNLIAHLNIGTLSQTEQDVYHLIISRFILAMSKDYVYSSSVVVFEVEQETFKATGSIPIKMGYRALKEALFPDKKGGDKKEENENPLQAASSDIAEGKCYAVEDTKIQKKQTVPPQEYTDGTLLKRMEDPFNEVEIEGDEKEIKESLSKRGLGTPATRASIIEELVKRGYAKREKQFLLPTERGIKMVTQVLPESLKTPDITAEWEYKMHQIARGAYSPQDFVNEVKRMVSDIVSVEKQVGKRDVQFSDTDTLESLGLCPVCGGSVFKRNFTKDGKRKTVYACEHNKKGGGCQFSLWSDDKFFNAITGGDLKETAVKAILNSSKRKCKVTAKKKDGSGTYPCYIVLKLSESGRSSWELQFTKTKLS